MDEILRIIDSLQTNDKHGVATPANWKPGEKVIVPAPTSVAQLEERETACYEQKEWYFSKRDL